LQGLGFTPFETTNLLDLRRRYERGALGDTQPGQRLRFARWLVRTGHLSEGQSVPAPGTDPDGGPKIGGRLSIPQAAPAPIVPRRRASATATAERCHVRAFRLVHQDEATAQSSPMAPVGLVQDGRHLAAGVVAIVIWLCTLGAFGAYALIAILGR